MVGELDRTRVEIARLLIAGRRAEAEALYHDQIEHRLDSALGALIDVVTLNERAQVEAAIATSARLARQTTALTIAVAAVVVLIGFANATLLERMISRPIAALAAGADAVGRGELTHVVGHPGRDELGNLAARFDLMTAQIRDQRDRLEQARATLAEQVEERTRQLRERSEALETAVERLRELDASRARFLADISHELRTPLTILRGQTEVALRNAAAGEDDLRQALRLVVRKADQMGRLVEDLLFLARSEAGSIEVSLGTVVLQDIIADVLLDSQALSRRAGVTISPRQPAEPVRVLADADRLRQAVLIALDNAVKFAPAGSAVVLELESDAGRAAIRVRDEGPGFTPDQVEAAFTRFYRGRSGRGAGLGLAIAKWIVDRHAGTISIASGPGSGGATVEIAVPLLDAAA
jgi:signal transduction histidine kinase